MSQSISMRRNASSRRPGHAAASNRLGVRDFTRTVWSPLTRSVQASKRRMLSQDCWKSDPEDSLDAMLSSALVAQDKELGRILQELDKISKSLKSATPDT